MSDISELIEIMARLRDPISGCPWDQQQDFSSIAPYTVEEAYEVADAIAREDFDSLRDELGDLLFQVVFHARMAEEQSAFDFAAVTQTICEKMRRRHPHVFGSEEEIARGITTGAWEAIKAAERRAVRRRDAAHIESVLDGIALALPSLVRAKKLGQRAASVGFDWQDASGPRAKIAEEMQELAAAEGAEKAEQIEEELGDLLFSVANLARHLKVDAEQALKRANQKFERRFRALERAADEAGEELAVLDIEALEERWQTAKKREDMSN